MNRFFKNNIFKEILFPAIFAIAGGIALILWYDLVGDKRAAMKAKLKECGL